MDARVINDDTISITLTPTRSYSVPTPGMVCLLHTVAFVVRTSHHSSRKHHILSSSVLIYHSGDASHSINFISILCAFDSDCRFDTFGTFYFPFAGSLLQFFFIASSLAIKPILHIDLFPLFSRHKIHALMPASVHKWIASLANFRKSFHC